MVVQIVHINSVAVVEPKRHSPVARDGYCVVPAKAALEGMQSEPGDVHTLRVGTPVEGGEDAQEFWGVP